MAGTSVHGAATRSEATIRMPMRRLGEGREGAGKFLEAARCFVQARHYDSFHVDADWMRGRVLAMRSNKVVRVQQGEGRELGQQDHYDGFA